ncbi:hypothetical protein K474DRAFT_1633121 [Panus rudis PR-1116 ss-1]|nr:hypothetical protein K474DRAFT_1633121 [Panus rudis PR-1116 ss-1]
MSSKVQRTYGSKASRSITTHLPSDLSSPPATPSSSILKRKRPLADQLSFMNAPLSKKKSTSARKNADKSLKAKQKQLTQLHFALETSVLRTCPLCDLSYTRGAPDDEALHRSHCARVQRGLEWGKEEEKEWEKAGVEELASDVKLKNGSKGRIICFRADVGGKIGAKLTTLLETINLALSSPPLSQTTLQASKAYLFLMQSASPTTSIRREKIVGCVIAQRISTAMAIVAAPDTVDGSSASSSDRVPADLVSVDPTTNLYASPTPLPTPLGIPRLFVSSSHRRLGIASRLLTEAAATFILGCPLDPVKGDVAFTQPTGAGKAVLENWGKGGVRVYAET